MNIPKISKRLEAAASFSQNGAKIADIGTDHAYLPIYLYTSGRISGGVASDINEGPVNRARLNIKGYGAQEKIEVIRTDGLCGIEKYEPDEIFILGMGGELIVKILADAPWVKNGIRLVLQPMTHAEILREYLWREGFAILNEKIVEEDKLYQIICAEYAGEIYTPTEGETFFGKTDTHRDEEQRELFLKLLLHTRGVYEQRIKGKLTAGADCSAERRMIDRIDEIIKGE
jgi:tRNA (adenine22-N1)-methyltransferase